MNEERVVDLPSVRAFAQREIRRRAKDTRDVIFGDEPREEMERHGVLDLDVLHTLRTGPLGRDPERTEQRDLRCRVSQRIRGDRPLTVVAVLLQNGKLYVEKVERGGRR